MPKSPDNELIRRLSRITPDTDPSYRPCAGGWWMLHGRLYPVPKPPLAPCLKETDDAKD
jgi:hypothetical protein